MKSFKSLGSFKAFMWGGLVLAYFWILYNLLKDKGTDFSVCPFRNVTGLPCPGCGITRSVCFALSGSFEESVAMNPLGLAVVMVLFVLPFFLLFAPQWSYSRWIDMENLLAKPSVTAVVIAFLIALWIYNIVRETSVIS